MKIQLKRSNILEGGAAKEPTAGQMEYGELAVNYNNGDPAVFLKDSNDNIIRIAGKGATGLDGDYVNITGDTMTGQLTLPGGGGATQALQKQEIEALPVSTFNNDSGYITLGEVPAAPVDSVNSQTGVVVLTAGDVGAATTAQGLLADSAIQPGDDISELNNDAGYITVSEAPAAPVDSVNSKTGAVVLNAADVGALASGDDISELNNDAGYITTAEIPTSSVTSVNTQTGEVVLNAADVGALASGDDISELNNDAGYITDTEAAALPYVEVAGDNMTGDLTLGTDKITLDATAGSATFAGKLTTASTVAGDAGTTVVTKDYLEANSGGTGGEGFVEVAGDNMTGSLTLGTNKITLNATAGTANFAAGDVNIDSSGRLLVGMSTSVSAGTSQYSKFQVRDNSANTGVGLISIQRDENAASITSGTVLGSLLFADNAGHEFGIVSCEADGTAGASNYPGCLVFSTTASGASSPKQRLQIDSSGNVLIGGTLPSAPAIKLNGSDGSATFAVVTLAGNSATQYTAIYGSGETRSLMRGYETAGEEFGFKWFQRAAANTDFRYSKLNCDPDEGWKFYARNGSDFNGSESPVITLGRNGSAELAGKLTTASTVAGDAGTTVVTKDYLEGNSGGTGGEGFVEVAGDNMTGSLTIGALPSDPRISLNANGSMKAGSALSFNTVGARSSVQNVLVGYGPGGDASDATFTVKGSGTLALGGTEASPNITLNATDGNASFAGNVTLPGGGGATQALQKQEIEGLISAIPTPDLTPYVEKAGDNMTGNLTLGTDKITLDATTGRGEFSGGVKVTGGGAFTVQNGMGAASEADGSDPKLRLIVNGSTKFQLAETVTTAFVPLHIKPQAGNGLALTFSSPDTTTSHTDGGGFMNLQADQTGATFDGKFSFVKVSSPTSQVDAAVSCPDMAGIRINNSFGKFNVANDGNTVSGLKLEMAARTGKNIYNILADGTAPNFLKGSTYIGGDTARNTFDLWKSTLTEEQLEELTAGTLVAPANVALPGDGSFVRQWYYDQQDAETQAELDAGTIDYPTHLAAATFTDTFDLGDNTTINLLSNGDASFSGTVTAKTGIYTDTITAVSGNTGPTFQTNNSSGNYSFKTTDGSAQANLRFNNLTVSRIFNFQDVGGTIALRGDDTTGTAAKATELETTRTLWGNDFNGTQNVTGDFKAENPTFHSTGTNNNYRFKNADGSFYGQLRFNTLTANRAFTLPDAGGTIALTSDLLPFSNGVFSVAMQADDPGAFTATTTTDEEGVETTTSVYNGTREDLLDIIKDLRARVAVLEGG